MKKERGAITVITLVTILFMLSFLISTFVIISNRRQAQAEIKKETKEIYNADKEDKEAIYQSYFADENETIPIYTAEQLFKIATGKSMVINNKIYKLTSSANYILMKNVDFKVVDYQTDYPDAFSEKTWTETENDTEVTKTANRWNNIEDQIITGTLTGTFNYNGKTITETDTINSIVIHNGE